MSRKKRLLRAGCVTALLLAFVGYFSFSTFFFPPFEARYKPGLAGLVPRSVDFFVARARLAELFDPFPRLEVVKDLEGHPGYEAFVASPAWAEFKRANRVDEGLAELEAALAEIPLGLDPLSLFGGEELALAGTFRGKGPEGTDWAVYGRASRLGKLAVSLLRFPGLLDLERQGITVRREGDVFELGGARLPRPIHVTRYRDVVVAGTSGDLVRQAATLGRTGSEDSLLLAAPYHEHIRALKSRDSKRRDFEIVLDVRALRDKWGMKEPWPNPRSQMFAPALLGRLFQIDAAKRVLGVVELDSGVSIDLYGDFSSELVSAQQARIYRERSFSHEDVLEAARAAPEDTTFFAYLHGPIAPLLSMAVEAMEPAMRENLTDALRRAGRYQSIEQLVTELDEGLHDRLALVARPNDWTYEKDNKVDPVTRELVLDEHGQPIYDGPPFTPEDVFAWTLVTWHENEQKLMDLREHIGSNGQTFGLRGREPGTSGFFRSTIAGNAETREFWSPFVPGTGHIATVNLPRQVLISNRYMMLDDLAQNILQTSSRRSRLTDRVDFATLLEELPPAGNLFVWCNPSTGVELLRQRAEKAAKASVEASIDLESKRRELDAVARRELFGGRPRNQLNADEIERLEGDLDVRVIQYRNQVMAQNLPAALAEAERTITYLASFSSLMALVDLDPRDFKLSLRAVMPIGQ